MKKKLIAAAVLVGLAVAAAVGYRYWQDGPGKKSNYDFTVLERGDLEDTVSCNGTLNPVTVVQVGTQVSGIVAQVYAEYNQAVTKDQLLARLDTSVLEGLVREAQAQLRAAQAQYHQAQNEYRRTQPLYESKFISESEFLPVQTQYKTTQSAAASAQAALERAERNLSYAYVRSPIDGVVIAKNVEAGQTMAASFNAPVLFEIAEDLARMEIIVEVDESDISQIRDGQSARFTVQAYPDRTFAGEVEQIRLQPVTTSNVVNYMVVVKADNPDKLLLPGMTAEVEFIVAQKKNVLLVKNSALRWEPTEELLAGFVARERKELSRPDGETADRPPPAGPAAGEKLPPSPNLRRLWYLDDHGQLAMEPVIIGMSDGIRTEVQNAKNLKEGMKVITGVSVKSETDSEKPKGLSLFPTPPKGRGPRF